MKPREWTPEEIKWLKENYPIQSDHNCRTHLHISTYRLRLMAKEMGLQKEVHNRSNANPVKKKKKSSVCLDADAIGYCQDCVCYVPGGFCNETKKETGALWQKKCFRREE
jgi:hypothetical protein